MASNQTKPEWLEQRVGETDPLTALGTGVYARGEGANATFSYVSTVAYPDFERMMTDVPELVAYQRVPNRVAAESEIRSIDCGNHPCNVKPGCHQPGCLCMPPPNPPWDGTCQPSPSR